MTPVDYVDVLDAVGHACGYQAGKIPAAEQTAFRLLINAQLMELWSAGHWPFLVRTQQRFFRPAFDPAATGYAAGVELYYPATSTYYQALKAPGTNQPPVNWVSGSGWVLDTARWAECEAHYTADAYDATVTYAVGDDALDPSTGQVYRMHTAAVAGTALSVTTAWGPLTDFRRYIDFEQTGEDAFDDCLGAWTADPRLQEGESELTATLSNDGVEIAEPVPYAWVTIRLRCPQFTGSTYAAATAYAAGDQMYYAGGTERGNFYEALTSVTGETPIAAPAKWRKLEIPAVFNAALVHAVAADWWRPRRGEPSLFTADREAKLAEKLLTQLKDRYFAQAVHSRRPVVGQR